MAGKFRVEAILVIGILAACFLGCPPQPTTTPPSAAFTGTPTSGDAPLTVQFSDHSAQGSAAITAWAWNFGDGGSSTDQNPQHQYTTAGTYTVSLTVTTSAGSDQETKTDYIHATTPAVTLPTAAFTGAPTIGEAPLTVQFTDQSSPGSAPITAWAWDFGDGKTSTEKNPQHPYTDPGVFTVALTVTTAAGSNQATKASFVRVNQPAAHFTEGTETPVVTQTVGMAGATLVVPAGSPIAGVTVEFPPGALPKDTEVTLGYDTGTLTTVTGEPGATPLVIKAPGVDEFTMPVTVTVPIPEVKDPNVIAVPFSVDDTGRLHLAQLIKIDTVNGTATFQTFIGSTFVWILDTVDGGGKKAAPASYFTFYFAILDGFQIANLGSTYAPGGECVGMTAFSLWYWGYWRTPVEGPLYPQFMDTIGPLCTDSSGNPVVGQDIIATRAYISIQQQWSDYWNNTVGNEWNKTDAEKYATIRTSIVNTASPVLIYLNNGISGPGEAAHSVLAFGYNGGALSIYDPNYPGTEQTIQYVAPSFQTYDGAYTKIMFQGDGSLRLTEPYTRILEDAKANFHSSRDALMTVTSHTSGQQVTTRNVQISGTVDSGQVAVTQVVVEAGTTGSGLNSFICALPFARGFSGSLAVNAGVNHLKFLTRGEDDDGNLIDLNNNLSCQDFTLVGNFPQAVLLVTLTWEPQLADLDLYITDPTGDSCYWYKRQTADGAKLDIDMKHGPGVEHFTLATDNTIRYGSPYKIRVHYYSGVSPIVFTVETLTSEGTASQHTETKLGYIAASNWEQIAPDAIGPDWWDGPEVTLSAR